MEILSLIITILSYLLVIFGIILIIFIYFSIFWSDIIVRKLSRKINVNGKKELVKLELQDISLFIQISISIGVALLLFSLSRVGVQIMVWMLFALISITTGIFLIFWRYLPLKVKMYEHYNSNKKNK
jgi:hypothetical protein